MSRKEIGAEGATGGMRPSGLGGLMVVVVAVVMMPGRGESRRREEHHQAEHNELLHEHHHGTIEVDENWKSDEESEEQHLKGEAGSKACNSTVVRIQGRSRLHLPRPRKPGGGVGSKAIFL
jgi:hypothetical protein